MSDLEWLQKWYKINCDGLWEHLYGIIIETLDNPGWHVKIELHETKYANLQPESVKRDNGDDDWFKCAVSNEVFEGFGDCTKLEMIIKIFRKWIDDKA
ncbi:MAG: immunity 53 family protein [Hespellia sp.]|nr:immunity 53 family protein [Hespellia sp.]